MIKVGFPYALDRLTLCIGEALYGQCEGVKLIILLLYTRKKIISIYIIVGI